MKGGSSKCKMLKFKIKRVDESAAAKDANFEFHHFKFLYEDIQAES